MSDQQRKQSATHALGIVIAVIFLLVIILVAVFFFFLRGDKGGADQLFGTFFGTLGEELPRPQGGGIIERPEGGPVDPTLPVSEPPRLRKISSRPAVGAAEYVSENGASIIRYMDAERGNIYDIDLATGQETRITNETIPRVHDAYFGANGRVVIFRYVDSTGVIKTQIKDIVVDPSPMEGGIPGTLSEGVRLADNVVEVSLSPDGNSLFYLTVDEAGGGVGRILDLPTRTTVTIFDFPISEWIPEFLVGDQLRLTTKAASGIEGYSYTFDRKTQRLIKLLGGKNSLMTRYSPSGERVIYNELLSSSVPLIGHAIVPESGPAYEEDHAPSIGFSTLVEKCAWTPDEVQVYCGVPQTVLKRTLPDDWYKGLVFFDDAIWVFDFASGESRKLAVPSELTKETIDLVNPFFAMKGAELVFSNKRDGFLWAFTAGLPRTDTINSELSDQDIIAPDEVADVSGGIPSTSTVNE